MSLRHFALLAVAALVAAAVAVGQEPTHMDAATHPARGQSYWRALFSNSEFEVAETAQREFTAIARVAYGLYATLATVVEAELGRLSADDRTETGWSGATLQLKYRLFKKDFSPLNTWMTSVFAGVTAPGDMGKRAHLDVYPRGALASTAILDRHGANLELNWEGYGGEPDRFAINASHLYRLRPVRYTAETRGAWYSVVESLNQFTDDGDSRSRVAVGLLYEARRWAWELGLLLPIAQRWPEEEGYRVTTGLRFLP